MPQKCNNSYSLQAKKTKKIKLQSSEMELKKYIHVHTQNHTQTHLVRIPEVLEEDGVTSGGENLNITEGVRDIWAERRSGGPHNETRSSTSTSSIADRDRVS